jgi:hypothetical protein
VNPLSALFPEGDYRFHLGLRPGGAEGFFRPRDPTGRLLDERRHWLTTMPGRHAQMLPGGQAPLRAFLPQAAAWGAPVPAGAEPLVHLGGMLEPDWLLLAVDARGDVRLQGGVLCFPTSWALEDKLGQTIDEIHGPVPGLNQAIGGQIGRFFHRLKPGHAFCRQNWGLTAVDELNLHPALNRPRPGLPFDPSGLWLRVEHQLFTALPAEVGWLFGIRIELIGLDAVRADPAAAMGLRRALVTMPVPMAAYKGLETVREPLLQWLA